MALLKLELASRQSYPYFLGLIGSLMSAFGIVTWREARRAGLLDPEVRQSSVLANANSFPVTAPNELDEKKSGALGHRNGNSGSTGPIPSFSPSLDSAATNLRSVPR